MLPISTILIAILISTVGNLLLKYGASRIGNLSLSKEAFVSEMIKVFTEPFIVIGLSGYVLGFLIWLKVLATTEVSRAYPILVSSTIVLVLIGSTIFFKENLSLFKIIGIFVIIFGIYLLFKS